MTSNTLKPVLYGVLASTILLVVYFAAVGLVSDTVFVVNQFKQYWYFIVSLAVGFGIQIALYQYLKNLVHSGQGMGKVVGVSGATSTVSMVSCCAHYLVNIIPILGITGIATFVAQYQSKIFLVGLAFNVFGIIFIGNRIIKFKKHL